MVWFASISRRSRLASSTGWTPERKALAKKPSTSPSRRRSKSRSSGICAGSELAADYIQQPSLPFLAPAVASLRRWARGGVPSFGDEENPDVQNLGVRRAAALAVVILTAFAAGYLVRGQLNRG